MTPNIETAISMYHLADKEGYNDLREQVLDFIYSLVSTYMEEDGEIYYDVDKLVEGLLFFNETSN